MFTFLLWIYAYTMVGRQKHHNFNSPYHKPVLAVTSKRRRSSCLGLSKMQDLPKQEDFPNRKIKDLYQKVIKSEAVSLWGKKLWITKKKPLQNLHNKHVTQDFLKYWKHSIVAPGRHPHGGCLLGKISSF